MATIGKKKVFVKNFCVKLLVFLKVVSLKLTVWMWVIPSVIHCGVLVPNEMNVKEDI